MSTWPELVKETLTRTPIPITGKVLDLGTHCAFVATQEGVTHYIGIDEEMEGAESSPRFQLFGMSALEYVKLRALDSFDTVIASAMHDFEATNGDAIIGEMERIASGRVVLIFAPLSDDPTDWRFEPEARAGYEKLVETPEIVIAVKQIAPEPPNLIAPSGMPWNVPV